MSTFLEKYGKQNKPSEGNGRVDFDLLKKERTSDFIKVPDGKKVSLVFLTRKDNLDNPFEQWAQHKGMQKEEYYSVPCDKMNKSEYCEICTQIEELKNEDGAEKENQIFYKPIEVFYEDYARVAIINEDGEISDKAFWFKVPKSVISELVKSEKNLESDEKSFYDREEPSKVIIEYNSSEPPATKYSCTIKPLKQKQVLPSKQVDEMVDAMKPLTYYTVSRSKSSLLEMFTTYLERKIADVETANNTSK